jgi:hypothetical protein
MNTWLLVFLWLGQIHATVPKATKEECIEMMKDLVYIEAPVCINTVNPTERIYLSSIRSK